MRVSPALRKRLDDLAGHSGRSLSQEVEFWIERAFNQVHISQHVMDLSDQIHTSILVAMETLLIPDEKERRIRFDRFRALKTMMLEKMMDEELAEQGYDPSDFKKVHQ